MWKLFVSGMNCGMGSKAAPHDTFYDNIPADHANYDSENMLFPQENPLIRGLVRAWQCGGQGFESP
jgi:hypothetical protein